MMVKLFEEGGFWLQETECKEKHNLDLYHKCPQGLVGSDARDILLPYEIKHNKCHFCGKLDIPDNIYTLWALSKK